MNKHFIDPSFHLFKDMERHVHDATAWAAWLEEMLPRPEAVRGAPRVLDLFAGCGGLSLGFECAGFTTIGYEMKPHAVASYNKNLTGDCLEAFLEVGLPPNTGLSFDVVIGGPPCQPFSQIGYQKGNRDPRDGFPVFLDAVRRFRPKIAIIENVRGLLFRNKDYLQLVAKEIEQMGYKVDAQLMNTSHFGVPQNRERVVIVAYQHSWKWPDRTVSSPVSVGTALGADAKLAFPGSRFLTASMDQYIARYEAASSCVRPRDLHLDQPSRTVTCRNLGGATSDMLRLSLPDGRRRMLTVAEGARLMSFPSWFKFEGREYDQFEQVGNAVAPLLALALAKNVRMCLNKQSFKVISDQKRGSLVTSEPIEEKKMQAQSLLAEAGLTLRQFTPRRRERVALCLLAVAQIKPADTWQDARSHLDDASVAVFTTRKIAAFRREYYSEKIADSSYDDVRRQDLATLVPLGLVVASAERIGADTNDGTRGYALTPEGLLLLRAFRTSKWDNALSEFRAKQGSINDRLSKSRALSLRPVYLPSGEKIELQGGKHNEIQKQVIEQFLPRFSRSASVLYLGDATKKHLVVDQDGFRSVGLEPPLRGDRLPDILAWEKERNWLFLIEAVHSSNPISSERYEIIEKLTRATTAGRIYVTAFLTRKDFASWLRKTGIAWETEVWCADEPDHCTHFNGDRFLGPYGGKN